MNRPITYIFLIAVLLLTAAPVSAFFIDMNGSAEDPLDVIVIDPGHGGEDAGALGPGGLTEKDITLSVALKLRDVLAERLGCSVLMTRTTDTFVSLEDRTAFANNNEADLFISIHVNAARSSKAAGVETFFMSYEATDEEAMRVAEAENNVVIAGKKRNEEFSDDLMNILLDLAQSSTHHLSSRLAESVHTKMVRLMKREDRGVKQAPFLVLYGAVMPAVLLEVGFVSNPTEARWLSSERDQSRIADAIAAGIFDFNGVKLLTGDGNELRQTTSKGAGQGL
jgi:N-acetylmuramoyl-L-alanine amidase